MAIEESKQSKAEADGRVHPKVGVVVVREGNVLTTAHRGQISLGDHAEYTALERNLPSTDLTGSTLYTTLEPCTSRGHKTPCADRIIQRRISRVVIGIVDPNPKIIGGSIGKLKTSGIQVDFASQKLEQEINALNEEFVQEQKKRSNLDQRFDRRLNEILVEIPDDAGPCAQVLIGPLADAGDYFETLGENVSLFTSFHPMFLSIKSSTPRRDRYQFESNDARNHFEVYVDGYLHTLFPMPMEDGGVLLGTIVYRVSTLVFYAIRLLKMRNVTTRQKAYLELSGLRRIEVLLTQSKYRLSRYYFPDYHDIHTFQTEFDPSASWKVTFSTIDAIYRDILVELGVTPPTEAERQKALKALLLDFNPDLKTEYHLTSGERVPAVDLRMFSES
jgi:pyrimidine deaminase RibD-like protein